MYTNINEQVKMIVVFDRGIVTPRLFRWHNRDYKVSEISMRYQEREGRSVNYFFGIETDNGNVFKLRYNDEQLAWWLMEVWSD